MNIIDIISLMLKAGMAAFLLWIFMEIGNAFLILFDKTCNVYLKKRFERIKKIFSHNISKVKELV